MDVAVGDLVGRERELGLIDELLRRGSGGDGAVLTLRGEPGAGKTTLLTHAREAAGGRFTVLACCGVEWEVEIPFSALHELLLPLAHLFDALPVPQRRELDVALGRGDGNVQGFHVYAAALSLVLEATRERPVLLLVDDLQWIDAASLRTLAFVGRRIGADAVAMLVGTRPGGTLPGLPDPVDLAPLDRTAIGELAARELGRNLPDSVLDELTWASAGNPLAVIESASHAGDRLWMRGAGLDSPLPVGALIERGFSDRLDGLSPSALAAALIVAESLADDDATIRRAVANHGTDGSGLVEAVDRRVLQRDGGRWRFTHPLLRSIVHRQGEGAARRAAHEALALAAPDPLLAAWHAAEAAPGTDAAIANALVAAVDEHATGAGASMAARVLERAADLTPDPETAAVRLVEAARAARFTAAPSARVRELTDRAAALARTEVTRVAAQLQALLNAADTQEIDAIHAEMRGLFEQVISVDDELAAEIARTMMNDALLAGRPTLVGDASALIRRVLASGALSEPSTLAATGELASAAVLHGEAGAEPALCHVATERLTMLDPQAMWRVIGGLPPTVEGLLWIERLDDAEQIARAYTELARQQGDVLRETLGCLNVAEVAFRIGDWSRAWAMGNRCAALSEIAGLLPTGVAGTSIAEAIEGLRTGVIDGAKLEEAGRIGEASGVAIIAEYTHVACGLVALAAGDPSPAVAHLEAARDWKRRAGQVEPSIGTWPVDLVHAYVLAGDTDAAREALGELREHAELRGRRWAQAAVPWLQAMLEEDDAAAFAGFELALERYPSARAPFEEARARLAYGQRLRRANRRADARAQLERALGAFEQLGSEPWAERARRELGASGKGGRRAAAHQRDELTLQERQVAALVAAGATNKEAAGELFLSPKTIETHLSRVYRKLGISSRTQLAARWSEID